MKKFFVFFLSIMMFALSFFGTGCLLSEEYLEPITINIALCEGTIENSYYMGAAQRFEEQAEGHRYSELYEGALVNVILCEESEYKIENQIYNGYDIYVTTEKMGPYVKNWSRKGYLYGLDDVFTVGSDVVNDTSVSIKDKIEEQALPAYTNDYYEYCALPNSSEIVGLVYDVNAFDKYGYFLADDENEAIDFYSELTEEIYYFTKPTGDDTEKATNKSAGVDGVFNTEDDGLPKTINEFVALCERIRYDDRYPFMSAGKDIYKADYLVQALMYSLMGVDEARACMNLDGELQVVTGFTNEPLFKGLNKSYGQIYKPKVEKVELSENCGYYASWALAKYYAEAFMELSVKMDWWADCSYRRTATAQETHYDFIFSGYDMSTQEALMLCESSAWIKSVEENGQLDYYNELYNSKYDRERRLMWMSMPTLFDGSEDYALERTKQTYQQVNPTYLILANQVRKNSAKIDACKDFLKFLCTELECNYYTSNTGFRKDFKYDFTLFDMYDRSDYYASLEQVMYSADIVYLASDTFTFIGNTTPDEEDSATFNYFEGGSKDSRFFYLKKILSYDDLTGEESSITYTTTFEYFRNFKNPTTKYCFTNRLYDKNTWGKIYRGYNEIGEYIGKDGKPVVFQG